MVSAASTGWAARHTWLGLKWTGAAETASANWSLPGSADVPSIPRFFDLHSIPHLMKSISTHLLSAFVRPIDVFVLASYFSLAISLLLRSVNAPWTVIFGMNL